MKTSTHEEISFTNSSAGIYLNKNEGAIAIDFKSSEIVLYLNTSLYQSFAWLVLQASETQELMNYINWAVDPSNLSKGSVIEVHGPDHAVCLLCAPKHERVQLNFEIGVSIDLKYNDFKGLIELVNEAQGDLDWRRHLLQWSFSKESKGHRNQDKKAI